MRDRDRLRENILRNLSWDIYRIWSTDWFRNPTQTKQRLLEYLNERLETCRENQETNGETTTVTAQSADVDDPSLETDAIESGDTGFNRPELFDGSNGLQAYRVWRGNTPDPRTIPTPELASILGEIIEIEGPITAERLYRAYIRASNLRRRGRQVRKVLNKALSDLEQRNIVTIDLDKAIIRSVNSPKVVPRVRGDRRFNEIPIDELAEIYRLVQSESLSDDKESVRREILARCNLTRMTSNVRNRLDEAVQWIRRGAY